MNTRVPVQALLDTLDEGGDIEEFLEGWPEVPREHAEAVLPHRSEMRVSESLHPNHGPDHGIGLDLSELLG